MKQSSQAFLIDRINNLSVLFPGFKFEYEVNEAVGDHYIQYHSTFSNYSEDILTSELFKTVREFQNEYPDELLFFMQEDKLLGVQHPIYTKLGHLYKNDYLDPIENTDSRPEYDHIVMWNCENLYKLPRQIKADNTKFAFMEVLDEPIMLVAEPQTPYRISVFTFYNEMWENVNKSQDDVATELQSSKAA